MPRLFQWGCELKLTNNNVKKGRRYEVIAFYRATSHVDLYIRHRRNNSRFNYLRQQYNINKPVVNNNEFALFNAQLIA